MGVFAGYTFDSLLSLKAPSAIGTLIPFSTFVSEIVFLFYVLVATSFHSGVNKDYIALLCCIVLHYIGVDS